MYMANRPIGGTGHTYLYLGSQLVATQLFDGATNPAMYQTTDTLGSVIAQTNSDAWVNHFNYYQAWGGLQSGEPGDGPAYANQIRDLNTGLSYAQQRYYDPSVGRFMSMDPVDANTVTGSNFNRYAYASDNPYRYTDPDGRSNLSSEMTEKKLKDWTRDLNATRAANQQADNESVGNTTVGDLSKILTNEIGVLSTPKGGDPKVFENGGTAIANSLIDNAKSAKQNSTAPDTGTASPQLANVMRGAYTNRAHGGVDPVHGRRFYATSHFPPNRLHSRPIGHGGQTVYAHFGPFKDSTSTQQTYIYIYDDPGH